MFTEPKDPLGLVDYAFRALGKTQVSLQQLVFFISFDLRALPPSKAMQLVRNLQAKDQLEIHDGIVVRPQDVLPEPESAVSLSNLGDLLRLFVSSSRLTRAVGMADNSVEFQRISPNPLKIQAIVHGSKDYVIELDEERRSISHNCPDWLRVSVLHRFCKHVAKLLLLLEEEEALRILHSLQKDSWEFIQV
ncbi:MAG: hypothetical protein ACFE9D_04775 [Promethearchaeota archaeon]